LPRLLSRLRPTLAFSVLVNWPTLGVFGADTSLRFTQIALAAVTALLASQNAGKRDYPKTPVPTMHAHSHYIGYAVEFQGVAPLRHSELHPHDSSRPGPPARTALGLASTF